jgi:hypothetical protein
LGKTRWRTEPGSVAIDLDDLWLGAKNQTNLEIAGSPRNILRYGLGEIRSGGKALDGLGGLQAY